MEVKVEDLYRLEPVSRKIISLNNKVIKTYLKPTNTSRP